MAVPCPPAIEVDEMWAAPKGFKIHIKKRLIAWQQSIRIQQGVPLNLFEDLVVLWNAKSVFALKKYHQDEVDPLFMHNVLQFTSLLMNLGPHDTGSSCNWLWERKEATASSQCTLILPSRKTIPSQMVTQLGD